VKWIVTIIALAALAALAACGGSDDGGPAKYTVSATVANLQPGTNVVLLNNGAGSLTVSASGTIAFANPVPSGGAYSVTVATQPAGQTCAVSQGAGTVTSFNVNVAVACTAKAYQVGGQVGGLLAGTSVVLENNANDSTTIKANGPFTLSSTVLNGSAYAVTVATQPAGQSCTVTGGAGTVSGANVSNVAVKCIALSYTIGASVTGLANVTGLVLEDNGADNLAVTSGGSYPFSTAISSGATYSVTISAQPAGHTCIVQNGSGTVTTANVAVYVVCPDNILYALMPNGVGAFYMDEKSGALVAVTGSPFAGGGTSIALTPNGRFAYTIAGNSVSAYAIDPTTGALAGIAGGPYTLNGSALSIAITPSSEVIFVLTSASNNVTSFNIDPTTGALIPTAAGSFSVGAGAVNVAIYPGGDFAYILGNEVTAYSIDEATGSLAAITNGSIAGSNVAYVFDPVGGFMYVSGSIASIYAYTVNTTTGLLSAVSGSPYAALQFPTWPAVSPNGQFLYVPGQGANQTIGYSVNSTTGTLASIGSVGSGVGGAMPQAIAVDPSGKFAYVDASPSIGIFTIDATTGGLSLVTTQDLSVSGSANPPFAVGSIH
jgi:6-phosphogluconolactonase (cycloisomerase 2 family)